MAAPMYTPATGYGTTSGGYTFTQNGWMPTANPGYSTPMTQGVLGANTAGSTSNITNNQPVQGTSGNTGQNVVPSVDPLIEQINNIFNPTMDYINSLYSTAQQQQPQIEADIQNQYATSSGILQSEKGLAEQDLAGQEKKTAKQQEDALVSARRTANETGRGISQRFGGASSAGGALSELNARQLQRNEQGIRDKATGVFDTIIQAKNTLQVKYSSAIKELETQKNTALNEARRYFQSKLAEISRLKAETESAKNQMKLDALQQYRNQVFQVNLSLQEAQQSVNQQASMADQLITQQEAQYGALANTGAAAASNYASVAPQYTSGISYQQNQSSPGFFDKLQGYASNLYNNREEGGFLDNLFNTRVAG